MTFRKALPNSLGEHQKEAFTPDAFRRVRSVMCQVLRETGPAVAMAAAATHGADPKHVAMAQRPNTQPLREPNRASYPLGAPRCRIYRPSPSAMQSARGKQAWLLEFEPRCCRVVEPLMGWTATDDPTAQLRLKFSSLFAAVDYAEREGLRDRAARAAADPHDLPRDDRRARLKWPLRA